MGLAAMGDSIDTSSQNKRFKKGKEEKTNKV